MILSLMALGTALVEAVAMSREIRSSSTCNQRGFDSSYTNGHEVSSVVEMIAIYLDNPIVPTGGVHGGNRMVNPCIAYIFPLATNPTVTPAITIVAKRRRSLPL